MEMLGVTVVILWLALNIGATLWALRSSSRSKQSRLLLVLLVWAVPLIGALVTFYVTSRGPASSQPSSSSQQSSDTMAIESLSQGSAETAIRMVSNISQQSRDP
jgi:thiol:disulfide interchange protein